MSYPYFKETAEAKAAKEVKIAAAKTSAARVSAGASPAQVAAGAFATKVVKKPEPKIPKAASETLYHYTSYKCMKSIAKMNLVRQTPERNDRYALYGKAVYLTTLPPETGMAKLIANNRVKGEKKFNEDKTSHYISFPPGALPNVTNFSYLGAPRNVYLLREDIDLTKCPYTIGVVEEL